MVNSEGAVRYPILTCGVPKSGSSMLRALALQLPGAFWADHVEATRELATTEERLRRLEERFTDFSPGAVYSAHLPHSPEASEWLRKSGVKLLFIYRDPRDYTVSWQHYVVRQPPEFPPYRLFAELPSDDERLMAVIRGIGRGRTHHLVTTDAYPNVRLTFEAFLGWLDDPNAYALRYEDLVAPLGGARPAAARVAVAGMLAHAGLERHDPDSPLVARILERGTDPARSYTYRRGVAGTWNEAYGPEHRRAFDEVAGDLLVRLGYETGEAGGPASA